MPAELVGSRVGGCGSDGRAAARGGPRQQPGIRFEDVTVAYGDLVVLDS